MLNESLPDKKIILLADDEQDILDVYQTTLEDAGFLVITATNGQEALDRLIQTPQPDLVLIDIKMPVMHGIDAVKKIKENPKTRDIPVVFLTAFSDPQMPILNLEDVQAMGAVDFIKKGVGLQELVLRIKEYLHLP